MFDFMNAWTWNLAEPISMKEKEHFQMFEQLYIAIKLLILAKSLFYPDYPNFVTSFNWTTQVLPDYPGFTPTTPRFTPTTLGLTHQPLFTIQKPFYSKHHISPLYYIKHYQAFHE